MHELPSDTTDGVLVSIGRELKHHVPFTLLGALTGIVIAVIFVHARIPHKTSSILFGICHPAHVFLSAVATTAMYRVHGRRGIIATVLVGYLGAVGIGTLSDSLIPYVSELLLGIHDEHVHAHVHLGFIEHWYTVNPLALLGVAVGCRWPRTEMSHAGHVLISTWASLFHLLMAVSTDAPITVATGLLIPVVLFVAVWLPCCTSDIVFPLLFAGGRSRTGDGQTDS